MKCKADLIALRAAWHEERSLLAKEPSYTLLQGLNSGIFTVNIISNRCRGHCLSHALVWYRERIAP